jgi:hypothetical protein
MFFPQLPQPGLPIAEWVKILISAVVGMTTGILVEPFKSWVTLRVVAGQGKKAIYYELARLYMFFKLLPPATLIDFTNISTDAFDFYYGQKREAFYRITNCHDLTVFYRDLKAIQRAVLNKEITIEDGAKEIQDNFSLRLNAGVMSKILLFRNVSKFTKRAMKYANVSELDAATQSSESQQAPRK